MNHQRLSTSSTSLKTRFALRFVRSLTRIAAANPTVSSMPTLRTRSRMIKLAADACMASAVGPKRTWSRAVLFKIRNRPKLHALAKQKVANKDKKKKKKKKETYNERDAGKQELIGENELRQVIPGGQSMDLFQLLEETAHYIKCLNTQVEVMQNIVDLFSPST